MADKPTLDDLPPEVAELIKPHLAENPATLEAISIAIAAKRDEAKAARKASGIEQTWLECEEAYVGIDDANRGEFKGAKWAKPMAMEGPVDTGEGRGQTPINHKSTVFIRETPRFVDAAAAKLGEILLSPNDKSFSFTATPLPDLVAAKEDTSQVVHEGLGVPLTRPAQPGEVPPMPTGPAAAPGSSPQVAPGPVAAPAVPGAVPTAAGAVAPPEVPLTVADLAKENIELADKKAKAAETRIWDWMVECQRTAEVRKVIHDAARIGVGVLKGPVPRISKAMALKKKSAVLELQIEKKVVPGSKWVDPWRIYPDPACGESIHDGSYIFEDDQFSERQVRELKDLPGYIRSQLDKVLEEGPDGAYLDDNGNALDRAAVKTDGRYTVSYFHGTLTGDEMDCIAVAAGAAAKPDRKREVYAIVTMINRHVVKAAINPLDSGSFPYHAMPWQRRDGHWAGVGVAEQIRAPQKILNGSVRAMMNNAGLAAGVQIVFDYDAVTPADGVHAITPNKIWYKKADSGGDDVRQAFQVYEIPNRVDDLQKVVDLAQRLAEESTSVPLITQGQSGKTTPDTFGAAQLQDNNANQLLRSIGYAFDDHITEPEVRQYYEWLLLDPDVPDDEKGDFKIDAHGSAALVERAIHDQTIAQLLPLSVQMPALGLDPKRIAAMYLKSKHIDPKEAQFSEEEQAKIAAQPPPAAPAIEVAKIRAAVDEKKIAVTQMDDDKDREIEIALGARKIGVEEHRAVNEMTLRMQELELTREIALLGYAKDNNTTLTKAKTELASVSMKLSVQERLSNKRDMNGSAKQVATPPSEPAGKAKPGQAYQA